MNFTREAKHVFLAHMSGVAKDSQLIAGVPAFREDVKQIETMFHGESPSPEGCLFNCTRGRDKELGTITLVG